MATKKFKAIPINKPEDYQLGLSFKSTGSNLVGH